MQIVHGSWIPDDGGEFVRRGAFYLWVETDAPALPRHDPGAPHPRQLGDTALAAFLTEKLGLVETLPGTLQRVLTNKYFLLPSADGKPLPSYELLHYIEEDTLGETELVPWQVCCCPVATPIATLNDIHFLAVQGAEDFQLGRDFLFWQQFTQALKGILVRDQYIPAITYRQSAAAVPKRRKLPSWADRRTVLRLAMALRRLRSDDRRLRRRHACHRRRRLGERGAPAALPRGSRCCATPPKASSTTPSAGHPASPASTSRSPAPCSSAAWRRLA